MGRKIALKGYKSKLSKCECSSFTFACGTVSSGVERTYKNSDGNKTLLWISHILKINIGMN